MSKKYKVIPEDVIQNIIDFLDEVQFDAATDGSDKESIHKINFCNWAINELLNSYDGYIKRDGKRKKSKDDYIEENLMDWNFPEMTEEEYEKLVDQFDAFFKGWKRETDGYKPRRKPNKSNIDKVVGHMSLQDIKDMLLDDDTLTNKERMDLYYEEHLRVQKEKEEKRLVRGAKPIDKIMKELGLTFSDGTQTLNKKKK
jgi:hypothetical protein